MATNASDFAAERLKLVRSLRNSGIHSEPVLKAMMDTPRHMFVASEHLGEAYVDAPLPIGESQTISQPWVVARMTEYILASQPASVLEVGTGSGYQAAVLARLVEKVFTVERIESLARKARQAWAALGLHNICGAHADGNLGWPAKAPFDAIMVTAGADAVPDALREQLGDGGRLVMPVGAFTQRLLVSDVSSDVTSDVEGDRVSEDYREDVRFVPLLGGLRHAH